MKNRIYAVLFILSCIILNVNPELLAAHMDNGKKICGDINGHEIDCENLFYDDDEVFIDPSCGRKNYFAHELCHSIQQENKVTGVTPKDPMSLTLPQTLIPQGNKEFYFKENPRPDTKESGEDYPFYRPYSEYYQQPYRDLQVIVPPVQ